MYNQNNAKTTDIQIDVDGNLAEHLRWIRLILVSIRYTLLELIPYRGLSIVTFVVLVAHIVHKFKRVYHAPGFVIDKRNFV